MHIRIMTELTYLTNSYFKINFKVKSKLIMQKIVFLFFSQRVLKNQIYDMRPVKKISAQITNPRNRT